MAPGAFFLLPKCAITCRLLLPIPRQREPINRSCPPPLTKLLLGPHCLTQTRVNLAKTNQTRILATKDIRKGKMTKTQTSKRFAIRLRFITIIHAKYRIPIGHLHFERSSRSNIHEKNIFISPQVCLIVQSRLLNDVNHRLADFSPSSLHPCVSHFEETEFILHC